MDSSSRPKAQRRPRHPLLLPHNLVLQFGTTPAYLAEWFVATLGIVIAVTLIYVFVLNRSPPPEGVTVSKLEAAQSKEREAHTSFDPSTFLSTGQNALARGDYAGAILSSVNGACSLLTNALRSLNVDPSNMNVSDMAYVIQSKHVLQSDITQPIYQLSLLRLKVAESHPVTQQEAEWALNTFSWLVQILGGSSIRAS